MPLRRAHKKAARVTHGGFLSSYRKDLSGFAVNLYGHF